MYNKLCLKYGNYFASEFVKLRKQGKSAQEALYSIRERYINWE